MGIDWYYITIQLRDKIDQQTWSYLYNKIHSKYFNTYLYVYKNKRLQALQEARTEQNKEQHKLQTIKRKLFINKFYIKVIIQNDN